MSLNVKRYDKLALFDLDKTLLLGVKAHRRAFHKSFEKIFGIRASVDIIDHQGMTDKQILIEVLKKFGFEEEGIKARMPEWISFMESEFKKAVKSEKIVALPGTKELLEELSKRSVLLGTVTGNLEPIGWGKLEKAGLKKYFMFGAFGSDAIERSVLVKTALKKAKERFGFEFDGNNAFLFGDTPRDIKAGRSAGVKTIGVATGNFSIEQLKESNADFVLRDLKDTKKVLEIIFKERV